MEDQPAQATAKQLAADGSAEDELSQCGLFLVLFLVLFAKSVQDAGRVGLLDCGFELLLLVLTGEGGELFLRQLAAMARPLDLLDLEDLAFLRAHCHHYLLRLLGGSGTGG